MITIVDYGVGNVKAFLNIYKKLNIPCQLANNINDLEKAEKLILPGVGSFDYAMLKLTQSGMKDGLCELVIDKKKPVLGICVGMQMLMNNSEEGKLNGLGWISGSVRKFNITDYIQYPLPHMGWNTISKKRNHSLLENLDDRLRFYFLHSYYVECENKECVLATAEYQNEYGCIINQDNIYGIQCHPEKSHQNGIQFLKNFAKL